MPLTTDSNTSVAITDAVSALVKAIFAVVEQRVADAPVVEKTAAESGCKKKHYEKALVLAKATKDDEVIAAVTAAADGINAKTGKFGRTALAWASRKGYPSIVRELIASGADVNSVETDGWTALIWASHFGHLFIVSLLITAGADMNATDSNGKTALTYALDNKHIETVRVLLAADAKL